MEYRKSAIVVQFLSPTLQKGRSRAGRSHFSTRFHAMNRPRRSPCLAGPCENGDEECNILFERMKDFDAMHIGKLTVGDFLCLAVIVNHFHFKNFL